MSLPHLLLWTDNAAGVVQIRVTPKTRSLFIFRALSTSDVSGAKPRAVLPNSVQFDAASGEKMATDCRFRSFRSTMLHLRAGVLPRLQTLARYGEVEPTRRLMFEASTRYVIISSTDYYGMLWLRNAGVGLRLSDVCALIKSGNPARRE